MDTVTVVSIMKDEDHFVEEWVAYHRILGVNSFLIYDDAVGNPLKKILGPYSSFVEVVPWYGSTTARASDNNQLGAYRQAMERVSTKWITFLDADEFIVLRKHANIQAFLSGYTAFSAVSLPWHLFGHCGYYCNPPDLITSSLIRRRLNPGRQVKSISKISAIQEINSAHMCRLNDDSIAVDPNGRQFTRELYPGKTDIAHINHYFCRSFKQWMRRVERGDVYFNSNSCPKSVAWRFSYEGTLRRFVKLSCDTNEYTDDFLVKFGAGISAFIKFARACEG